MCQKFCSPEGVPRVCVLKDERLRLAKLALSNGLTAVEDQNKVNAMAVLCRDVARQVEP